MEEKTEYQHIKLGNIYEYIGGTAYQKGQLIIPIRIILDGDYVFIDYRYKYPNKSQKWNTGNIHHKQYQNLKEYWRRFGVLNEEIYKVWGLLDVKNKVRYKKL